MKRNLKLKIIIVKAAVSAAFFFILFSFVQRNELVSVLARINWLFFILSFTMAVVMLMVSCLKWKLLLNASGQQINYFTLVRIYLIGYFFSNLLPSTVGGDLVRSYYVGKLIENQASAATSVFLERFTGMVFLLMLVIFAPLMDQQLYWSPFVYIPAISAAFFVLLILWIWKAREPLSVTRKTMKYFFTVLHRWSLWLDVKYIINLVALVENLYGGILKRMHRFKSELHVSLTAILSDKWLIFNLFVLTAVFYLLTWLNVYIAFLTFGVHPGFFSTSSLVPTIMFVGQIPLTLLGNLGFIESVYVFYFSLIHIPAAASLAMGFLLRVKLLCFGFIGYLFYLLIKHDKDTIPIPPLTPNKYN